MIKLLNFGTQTGLPGIYRFCYFTPVEYTEVKKEICLSKRVRAV